MAAIKITEFKGYHSHTPFETQPGEFAEIADNVLIEGGALKRPDGYLSWLDTNQNVLEPKTIYMYTEGSPRGTNSQWLTFTSDANVCEHMLGSDDVWDRRYFTGGGFANPRAADNTQILAGVDWQYPETTSRLGVPPPGWTVNDPNGGVPTLVVGGTPDDPNDPHVTRFYLVTMVDKYGQEGGPCLVSLETEVQPGETVTVTLPAEPTGDWSGFYSMRIYRAATGLEGSTWRYVGEVLKANNYGDGATPYEFTDALTDEQLGELLVTESWALPHEDMIGLTESPNGFLCGFWDNTIAFSQIGAPYAWPVQHQYNIRDKVVALVAQADSVIALTTSQPYILSGSDPRAMYIDKTNLRQPCVTKRGVVEGSTGVLYPGTDGIVSISTTGASLITQGVVSKKEWATTFNGGDFKCATEWKGNYIFSVGGHLYGINIGFPETGIIRFQDLDATALWTEPGTNAVFFCASEYFETGSTTNYQIYEIDGGTLGGGWVNPALWKSSTFSFQRPTAMTHASIGSTAYPVRLKLYYSEDNTPTTQVLHRNMLLTDETAQPISLVTANNEKSQRWRVEITDIPANASVYGVTVGSSMKEVLDG